ncbi:hypothetical protein PsYK624_088040 [Phanerochaete sordida]|uniref:Fungal-type protein kinase domain-containing protein n=1 Tax=Phanerochaete sordida TaxID=48140 RepID=A0A9P3LFH9_9APHY|nr:hypothetical protein PsYK624_088040 [Phanerochaete sordida]
MSAGNGSPTGRATRGYIAFEVETKRMVFLKDSWRAVSRKHTELETYRRLHAAEVEFIATPVAGGDISEQRTKSQSFMQNRPANMRPAERVHTRLVTKEIGRALETYEGSFELISFVYHAFFGHQDAWEKAGVLHHDISPGNILINIENGHGFLNDWDLAKYREDLEQGIAAAEPAGVSGTWPFKSALALRYPTKPAEVADDIESFIYIILYFSMRFHLHALSSAAPKGSSLEQQRASNAVNERLAVMFYDVFHAAERLPDGHSVGGTYKKLCIKTTFVPIQLQQIDNKPTPLARFLEKAYALLHRHYKRVNHAALASFAFKSTVQHTEMDAERKAAEEKAEQGGENLRSMWGLLERRAVPTYAPSSRGSTPSSRASSSALRPLDTHAALLNLFDHAFVNEDGSPMNIAPYRVDVLYDQCIGQNVMTSSRRKAYHGVDLRKLLSEARRQYCSGDSKDTGISDLASVAEVDEPVQEAENPRPGPRTRSGRGRTTRKVESPKRVAATKKPPAKKATSSTKAKGASRAATAQKKSTARKSAAMPRKADTTSTEPATGMRSLHVKKGAATTHCARRSTRLAVEVAQPPSPSGKRKRVDGGLDATAEAPELRIAAKRRPTARNKANDQQAPQRRSTRLAAKSGKTA